FWVAEAECRRALGSSWKSAWLLGFTNVTSLTNERTFNPTVIPRAGVGNSMPLIVGVAKASNFGLLYAILCAFAFDYCVRQKIGGVNLNFFIVNQLPVIPSDTYIQPCQQANGPQTLRNWLLPRVLELTYTAWDLEPFARDCGWNGPPFRCDEERRFLLRCELDAAFFHLYLGPEEEWRRKPESLTRYFPTPRHAVDYIMDTFPIVKRKDEEKWGEYRTKRVILEIYDEMAEAMRKGIPYQTRFNPPPGPSENGLPDWKPGQPKPANWPYHIHAPKGCETTLGD
ncbi:MAG: hypothetical protein QME78_13835, partial [Thermodesulfobacteriota bacterium]|nr:hypothetical protein [Thermodesulfobacteriota bacterium]